MWLERTELIVGEKGITRYKTSSVAVFGVGGVGSYAVEALARSGVGCIMVVDDDEYSETNINRQLYATTETVGKSKVFVAEERIKTINPLCKVFAKCQRFTPENQDDFDLENFDYVIDAIDSLDCKVSLIKTCREKNIPIVSSMGAGNRLKPEKLELTDIFKTYNDPLAKAVRTRLKKEGITSLNVVFSSESPTSASHPVGSFCPVTATAGMILSGKVLNDLLL